MSHIDSELTIYFDGDCPLCRTEMQKLKVRDQQNLINLIDIQQPDFNKKHPQIDYEQAMKVLHGWYKGDVLLGLAVTHRSWSLVGKGFWVAPLAWPIVKTICHWVYLAFAKYRHQISRICSKIFNLESTHCQSGVCHGTPHNDRNRRQ